MIVLNDQRTTIRDILTSAEGFVPAQLALDPEGKEFFILLRDLYKANKNNIDVQSGDHFYRRQFSQDKKDCFDRRQ